MTLKEVFESLNLTAYDLTVDMLDVHAVSKETYFILSTHGRIYEIDHTLVETFNKYKTRI